MTWGSGTTWRDGWYGDRVPQSRDLALALAYAGVEAHATRRQLNNEELARLPESITVAPLEHLAAMAPDLDLAAVHRLAGAMPRSWPTCGTTGRTSGRSCSAPRR